MRMSIYEAGQDNSLARVNNFTIGIDQRFNLAPAADGFDPIATHEQPAIFNDCELTQIAARASAFRARERDNL